MPQLRDSELVTEPCRLAFPSLFQKKPKFPDSQVETYQAVILIPPTVNLEPFKAAMKAAMQEKWGKPMKIEGRSNPLQRCDDSNSFGELKGWWYIRTHSGYQPAIVDQKRQEIIDPNRIFAGCWCRFHVNCFAWDNKGGKGLSFGLNAVQLVREDSRMDGRRKATDVFEPIESTDEAPAASGDEELFG